MNDHKTKNQNMKVYNSQIKDLLMQIRCICNQAKIPYFFAFGINMSEDGTYHVPGGLVCSALLPEILELPSNDPKFARMINVVNGFSTTAEDHTTLNIDDLPAPAKLNEDHSIDFSSLAEEDPEEPAEEAPEDN